MEKVDVKIKMSDEFILDKGNIPTYQTDGAAGFDLMAAQKKDATTPQYIIEPGETKIIPTGLSVEIPDGYEIQIRPRSGTSLKTKLRIANAPGTVDCFSEDSDILTIDGNKKIQEIKIDEIIFSVNEECVIEKDVVSAIVCLGYKDVINIETDLGILKITENTIVYTKNSIKYAKDLTEEDEIIFSNTKNIRGLFAANIMKFVKIKKIKKSFSKTYDITVSNNHNFFCNNFLIGNSDYRGEVGIICNNTAHPSNAFVRSSRAITGKKPTDPNTIVIEPGERIAQGVLSPVYQAKFSIVDAIGETNRGSGGFGSTGNK
jgi:deoxyuridine 5'-triphosphate nucleotidohydrolase